MKNYSRITPEGTKDVLFKESKAQREVERRLSELFLLRGYSEVITPGIEYYDVFSMKGISIPQEEMFKTTDNKGKLVVFRPDSTYPIARMIASRLQNAYLPIRLFYNQSVYRNRADLSGKNKETAQMGIELIGASGIRADIEVISTAIMALDKCNIRNYRLEIGNATLFNSLSEKLLVSDNEKEEIRSLIESKNYAVLNNVLDSLDKSETVEAIRMLPRLFGGKETLKEAEKYCTDVDTANMLSYMTELYQALSELGLEEKIMVDLGLVQRNEYYTGVVFSAYVEQVGDAVLVGGRYDNLLENFGYPMPAIGFSLETDIISQIFISENTDKNRTEKKIAFANKSFEIKAQEYVNEQNKNGVRCELALFDSVKDTVEYAKNVGITKMIIIDEDILEQDISEVSV